MTLTFQDWLSLDLNSNYWHAFDACQHKPRNIDFTIQDFGPIWMRAHLIMSCYLPGKHGRAISDIIYTNRHIAPVEHRLAILNISLSQTP